MGAIQQSINSALSAAGQAAGVAKGISELNKKNELEVNKAKEEHINEVNEIRKEYNEEVVQPLASTARELRAAKKEQKAASAEFADAMTRGTELDEWFPPRKPATEEELDDLAGKATIAKDHLNSIQELSRTQKKAYKKRQAELQKKLDLVNERGALYGITPDTLKEGKNNSPSNTGDISKLPNFRKNKFMTPGGKK